MIAVGALGCSFDELKSNTDGSGIAVYILHYKGDKLWDMGDKVYPDVIIKAVEEKIGQGLSERINKRKSLRKSLENLRKEIRNWWSWAIKRKREKEEGSEGWIAWDWASCSSK